EEIENTGDGDYPRVREDFERLILWRKSDPVKMDCESGDKDCQIKIDAGQRGETERNGQQVKLFHARNICAKPPMSRAGFITGSSDECRMSNDELMTKHEFSGFVICRLIIPSSLDIRHSSFILRHARHPSDSREAGFRVCAAGHSGRRR